MYPLPTKAHWPENQWYVAGFSSEIGTAPIARTYLNKRVVLFRDSTGGVVALSGICPHRMMPMEKGVVENDRIACGYHGLAFDLNGLCVDAPTSERVPDCKLEKYPLVEQAPLVWIWLGDPARAETTPLPDQMACHIGDENWLTQCVDYNRLGARYMLLIDNLFDLSHIGFVHASILGAGGIALVPPTIDETSDRIIVSRLFENVPVDEYHRFLFPHAGERMSVRLDSDQIGISLINAGGPAFDGPDTNSPVLGHQNFIHALTPETESSTHYWNLMTRDFRKEDEQLSEALSAQNMAVVAQDVEALEGIEAVLGNGRELPREISMKSDQGALRARLRIIQMIRAEDGEGPDNSGLPDSATVEPAADTVAK